MSSKKTIVITDIGDWVYFQWFIYGFYLLKRKKQICLKFKLPPFQKMSTLFCGEHICKLFYRMNFKHEKKYLRGFLRENGKNTHFCIDCSDSPFIFNTDYLKNTNKYFKIQCPKFIDKQGFRLNKQILIPFLSDKKDANFQRENISSVVDELKNKIMPLMVGPRRMSYSNTFCSLNRFYKKAIALLKNKKTKSIMCYFNNDISPTPQAGNGVCDFDSEASLCFYYKNNIDHPNIKRGKMADIINDLDSSCDGRIINRSDFSPTGNKRSASYIKLKDFPYFVSSFKWNVNISGFRLSAPNRFLESFMVGTRVFTDKLHVKWFDSFGDEVFETIDMGYEFLTDSDWDKITNDLKKCLVDEKKVDTFSKWAPEIVANYILQSLKNDD